MAKIQGHNLTFSNGSTAVANVVSYGKNESGNVVDLATSSTGGEIHGVAGPVSREVTVQVAEDDIPAGFTVNATVVLTATSDGTNSVISSDSYIVKTIGTTVATQGVVMQNITLGLAD